ncbi:uncharacterized protein LOC131881576 isoform X2 [Tigriopus californicus]|uniref:uncharacterized protein LOC131881576 isoform X2 n=1 Tax=Tigriopus californicus TaxID=6832 RepID=UPI0027D9EDB3|nr:uncharacterized protein LOC131881576 isoform X2 [Tigriopus californicus]
MIIRFRTMDSIVVCITLITLLLGFVSALHVQVAEDAVEDSELKKIGDYFQAKEHSSLILTCEIRREVILSGVNSDSLKIDNEIYWSYSEHVKPYAEKLPEWTELQEFSPQGKICRVLQDYVDIAISEEKKYEIFCTQELHLNKLEPNHEGNYKCNATLQVTAESQVLITQDIQEQIQLFVAANDLISFVVTCIIITVVILVIISGVCCRVAGHRFAWEHSTHRVHEQAMDHLQSMHRVNSTDENGLWYARNRYMSNASNMSGIVFQTDTEGMAKLMERLDNVEDGTSESSSKQGEDKITEVTDAGVSITLTGVDEVKRPIRSRKTSECGRDDYHKMDNDKPRPPPLKLEPRSFAESKPSHLRVSALPTPTTPGRLRKAFSFFNKALPTTAPPINNNKTIFPLPKRSATNTNLKRRRSMLGIFPSGIGIGSGAIYGDDEVIEDLMAIENARKGHFGDNVASMRQKQLQQPPLGCISGTSPPNAHGFDHGRFQSARPNSPMRCGSVRRSSITEAVIKEEEPVDTKETNP